MLLDDPIRLLLSMDPKKIGLRIRELRIKAGMSQSALGEMSGVGQDQISRYEAGRRPMPESLFAIADALQVTVDELLKPAGPTPPSRKGRPKKTTDDP